MTWMCLEYSLALETYLCGQLMRLRVKVEHQAACPQLAQR